MSQAVYAIIISFVVCIASFPLFIPYLIKLKFGQYIRGEGPESHKVKAGTPTMGGIMIIVSFLVAALVFARGNPEVALVAAATGAFGFIGFLDDFISLKRKTNLGLRAYQKLIGQIAISIGFIALWSTMPGFSSELIVPFFPDVTLDVGFLFPALACLVFLSATNGSNLTDGVDGLASSVTVIIAVFFMFAAWFLGSEVLPVAGALIGALLGFIIFNSKPARVFMGDTGSLALGGFVAGIALILGMPLFLIIVAIIYVIESLSVIIQVGYFKLTKGKRFFKMAPIHHSFELSGWSETKIVALFSVITTIACFIGYLALVGI